MALTEHRVNFANKMLNGALKIVCRTRNEEVKKVWDHIMTYGCLVEPDTGSKGAMQLKVLACLKTQRPPKTAHELPPSPLYITPIYAEDGLLDPIIKTHWGYDLASAIYEQQLNLITLNTDFHENSFIMGCRLLHEGNHAWRAWQEHAVGQPNTHFSMPGNLREEVAIQTVDKYLWRELNPEVYDRVIDTIVYRIGKQAKPQQSEKKPSIILERDDTLLAQLELFLGPAPGERQLTSRWCKLEIQAMYTYFERFYPNPLAAKMEFTKINREEGEAELKRRQT